MDSPPSALLDVLSRRYHNCALRDLEGISRNPGLDGSKCSRNLMIDC